MEKEKNNGAKERLVGITWNSTKNSKIISNLRRPNGAQTAGKPFIKHGVLVHM
jgi:hypothetical protein